MQHSLSAPDLLPPRVEDAEARPGRRLVPVTQSRWPHSSGPGVEDRPSQAKRSAPAPPSRPSAHTAAVSRQPRRGGGSLNTLEAMPRTVLSFILGAVASLGVR